MIRRAIVFTHRWLGITGGLLILLWLISGIAMLWAGMPELDESEYLRALPALDLDGAQISTTDAAEVLHAVPERVSVSMLGERPVFRFANARERTTVLAGDGRELAALDQGDALRLAQALFPARASTARHDRRLTSPDQWTLQIGGALPAHRIRLGDDADTWIYISERSGELVLTATRAERRWAYVSAVPHWLYATPLRRHGPLWSRLVIALSLAGCVLTLSGLVWGGWQALRGKRTSTSRARISSPYSGLMRWHHYTGLAFGLFTFTWVFSGCLSMDPWNWHASTDPTPEQAAAVAGASPSVGGLTLERLRAAVDALAAAGSGKLKELDLVWFGGEPYWRASTIDAREGAEPEHRLVPALHPERGALTRFAETDVLAAARAAMPEVPLLDAVWLTEPDDYYYGLYRAPPLPVLRARFGDRAKTWIYIDPSSGAIVLREQVSSRVNRWIYHGFHSFDYPFLRKRPALRYGIVIVLSLGGILVAATSLRDGWRRLARRLRPIQSRH